MFTLKIISKPCIIKKPTYKIRYLKIKVINIEMNLWGSSCRSSRIVLVFSRIVVVVEVLLLLKLLLVLIIVTVVL